MITNKDVFSHKFYGLKKERQMKTYHSFIFNITHDVIMVDENFHTTVPKRHTIFVTISDEDVKRKDAVNLAFYEACKQYKELLLDEQMYHN